MNEDGDTGVQLPDGRPLEEVWQVLRDLSDSLGLAVPSDIGEVERQMESWIPEVAYTYRAPGLEAVRAMGPSAVRRCRFRRVQRLWKLDRGRAVREVLADQPDGPSKTVPQGTQEFWGDLFGRPSPLEGRSPTPLRPPIQVVGPVMGAEVGASTASGPDGRTLAQAWGLGVERVSWVFNALLWL